MAITRTPIHDDDGSGTTGTIIDNAWKQELYGQIDAFGLGGAAAEVLTVAAAGAIALSAAYLTHVINLTPAAGAIAVTWSGGAGVDGERVILYGRGAGWTTIANGGAISNIATSAPTPIATGGSAIYTRVGGVWVLTAHEQGAPISAPFSAANFTGPGGGWTVQAGDVAGLAYILRGRAISVYYTLATTSVTAGTTSLNIGNGAYGGFTSGPGLYVVNPMGLCNDAGVPAFGAYAAVAASAASVQLYRPSNAPWSAATDSTYTYGQITFPVG